jgi:hypothetical protein
MHICVLIGHKNRSKGTIYTIPLAFATKRPTSLSFDIFKPPIEGYVAEIVQCRTFLGSSKESKFD